MPASWSEDSGVEEGFEEARAIGHVVGRIVVARGNHVVPQLRAVAQPRLAEAPSTKEVIRRFLAAGVEPVKHAHDVHHRVGRVQVVSMACNTDSISSRRAFGICVASSVLTRLPSSAVMLAP